MRDAVWGALMRALAVGLWIFGCEGSSGVPATVASPDAAGRESCPAAAGSGACPAGWVAGEQGGCGPAVLWCGPDGGGALGACDAGDATRPHAIDLPDGGTLRGFRRLSGGGLGGAWPEPGEADGPPEEDWAPDAGALSCPAAWQTSEGTCNPQSNTDCPAGSEALPGGACTATAERDCPTGEYPDLGAEAVGARVVQVRAGADAAAADGGLTHPYATLEAGIRAAGEGGWVRVAAGVYREPLVVGGTTHVIGVCAARVTVSGAGPTGLDTPAVAVRARGRLTLRGVTVQGAGHGILVLDGATLAASRVAVVDVHEVGIGVSGEGSSAALDECIVRGTHPRSDGGRGYGLDIEVGGQLVARRVSLRGNAGAGVFASGRGARASLTDSAAHATRARPDGTTGYGLNAQNGAEVRATRVVAAENEGAAVAAVGPGALVALEDVVLRGPTAAAPPGARGIEVAQAARVEGTRVRIEDAVGAGVLAAGAGAGVALEASTVTGTRARSATSSGVGVTAESGGHVAARDSRVEASRGLGVLASGAGSRVELTRCAVEGTRPRADGTSGRGVVVQTGASARLEGSLVARNAEVGVLASTRGEVVLDGSVVRDTQPRRVPLLGRSFGWGVNALQGGVARLVRTRVTGNTEAGVLVSGQGSRVTSERSRVDGTRASGGTGPGFGVAVESRATAQLVTTRIEGSVDVGVLAGSGSRVEVVGSVVRATARRSFGTFGRGLAVQDGASAFVWGSLFAENHEAALFVSGAESSLAAADVLVVGVAPSVRGFGVGLYVIDGARAELTRTAIRDVAGAGVVAAPFAGSSAQVDLRDVLVTRVQDETIRFSEGGTAMPEGSAVAYGLHAGEGSVLNGERVTLTEGGYGFYNAGTMTLQRGFIARQRDAAGAFAQGLTPAATRVLDVATCANASDAVAARDLPSSGALESSSSACDSGDGCP